MAMNFELSKTRCVSEGKDDYLINMVILFHLSIQKTLFAILELETTLLLNDKRLYKGMKTLHINDFLIEQSESLSECMRL